MIKEKILDILKNANGFVSGEQIGKKLGITRASVSKNIAKLREYGYNIYSVNNKGHWLEINDELLNEFEIKSKLKTELIGQNCKFFNELTSTNDEAKKHDIDGTVIVCEKQTAGKGRRGNVWESPYGTGLWFSIVLKPDITPMQSPQITLLSGIAVCKAIRELTGLNSMIKWPNDIIIDGKKAVGILTEISAEIEKVNYIVVGIGINVNTPDFPDFLKEKATSLKLCKGENVSRIRLLKAVLENLEVLYKRYTVERSFEGFAEEYKSLCINIGKDVAVNGNTENISGIACDISKDGELVIKTADGELKNIFAGEVSVRRQDGSYI